MTILRCKDVTASFNRRSASLKADAIKHGMTITSEWLVDGLECFHAAAPQEKLKVGLGLFAEAGACVYGAPRVWFAIPGAGRDTETVFLPKLAKQ